jgi:hypothetical protein
MLEAGIWFVSSRLTARRSFASPAVCGLGLMIISTALRRMRSSRSIHGAANVWAPRCNFAGCTVRRWCFFLEPPSVRFPPNRVRINPARKDVQGQQATYCVAENSERARCRTTRIFMTVWNSSSVADDANDRRRSFAEALSAPGSLPHSSAGLAGGLTAPRPTAVGRRQPPLTNSIRASG